MDQASGDYVGMLATVMNALALQSALKSISVPCRVQTAIQMNQIAEPYLRFKAIRHLEKGRVVIFAAGTGNPFFTTDTACAIRAIDMHADLILMGKDGVDGVYSADPNKVKNAKFFKSLTFLDAISKKLGVMDLSALTLCMENNIDIYVFDVLAKDNILKTYKKKSKFTHIHK